ncbi:MAG: FMN-binding protein [Desulfobacterales bacterium]|nr:FMN-binding protein [Desulfobacterales bacterium]
MEHALEHRLPEPDSRFRNSNLAQAWLVLTLAVFFGATLAAVQVNLSGIILENKQNETLERVPELIWGAADTRAATAQKRDMKIIPGTLSIRSGTKTKTLNLYKVIHAKELAGWVIKASGQGYADKIDLLIGVDPEVKTLTGLFILDQKETPGLGNKITFPGWRRQFVGKSISRPLVVAKGTPGEGPAIDAITGATISSRSVTRIINRVMDAVKGKLTPETVQMIERQK